MELKRELERYSKFNRPLASCFFIHLAQTSACLQLSKCSIDPSPQSPIFSSRASSRLNLSSSRLSHHFVHSSSRFCLASSRASHHFVHSSSSFCLSASRFSKKIYPMGRPALRWPDIRSCPQLWDSHLGPAWWMIQDEAGWWGLLSSACGESRCWGVLVYRI